MVDIDNLRRSLSDTVEAHLEEPLIGPVDTVLMVSSSLTEESCAGSSELRFHHIQNPVDFGERSIHQIEPAMMSDQLKPFFAAEEGLLAKIDIDHCLRSCNSGIQSHLQDLRCIVSYACDSGHTERKC